MSGAPTRRGTCLLCRVVRPLAADWHRALPLHDETAVRRQSSLSSVPVATRGSSRGRLARRVGQRRPPWRANRVSVLPAAAIRVAATQVSIDVDAWEQIDPLVGGVSNEQTTDESEERPAV